MAALESGVMVPAPRSGPSVEAAAEVERKTMAPFFRYPGNDLRKFRFGSESHKILKCLVPFETENFDMAL